MRHVGCMVSQWSSLACHPIVDDDVQSAGRLSLIWAGAPPEGQLPVGHQHTQRHAYIYIHTHTHTHTQHVGDGGSWWLHYWDRVCHQQSTSFRVTRACIDVDAILGCITTDSVLKELHTLSTHSYSREKADVLIFIQVLNLIHNGS